MKKHLLSMVCIVGIISISVGCGKIHVTIGDNKTQEEQVEEEINKILEDESIDNTLKDMEEAINTIGEESDIVEQVDEDLMEEEEDTDDKKNEDKIAVKKSIDDYDYNEYIYSEDEEIPYIEGEIEEVDFVGQIIQKIYSGDETYKQDLLTYDYDDGYIPITEEDIKDIEKELKLIRISLELTDSQKIDTKIFQVEYQGFATFGEEKGCHLGVGYYIYPEGEDSYVHQFCGFDVIEINGELKAAYY